MSAASSAVNAPSVSARKSAEPAAANSGNRRAVRKTPATTIVAEWMIEETGVGPSIASGSQTCSGNSADLPQPPANSRTAASASRLKLWPPNATGCASAAPAAGALTAANCTVPSTVATSAMPIRKNASAKRVMTNAFFEASTALGLVYQKPIST